MVEFSSVLYTPVRGKKTVLKDERFKTKCLTYSVMQNMIGANKKIDIIPNTAHLHVTYSTFSIKILKIPFRVFFWGGGQKNI